MVIFPRIDSLSIVRFKTSDRVLKNKLQMKLQENFGILKLPKATVYINLSGKEAFLNLSSQQQKKIKASGVFVKYRDPEAERLKILNEISLKEIYRLKAGQFLILLREHLFLGRKISTRNYLDDPGKIENISNW
jgi:mRNA-degrading endonuclease RelE of RelBE toxin-antitoxin system